MRAESIVAGAIDDRTRVIHNWADSRAIVPVDDADNRFVRDHQLDGKFVVLYSGNAGRAHTFDAVIGAMHRLQGDADIVFVFVGGGNRSGQLRATVERAGLSNARFLNYVARDQLSHSLSAASVSLVTEAPEAEGLLVPSKAYGILASGRPLVFVGSLSSDVAELVRREHCGFVIAPDDADGLTDVIRRLKASSELRSALGEQGRRAAETVYDRRIATSEWARELAGIM
jgi:colanic acid biosynthesis glycosyl transferase WcaI